MDRSPALLLLLALGLCEYGHGASLGMKVRSPSDITQLQVGQRLELECQTDRDSGAFWIRQDKSGTLHFIVFINSMSRATFSRDQRTSPERFEAKKHNTIYQLVVKSFTPQDEGTYFCTMIFMQMLFFSPGQPAFLPGQQHLHPASLSPARMPPTSCPTQEDLDHFCLVFLWVPLAGLCLLLLQLLAISIVLCRRRKAHHNP
ncbi:CD8A protein, partial [Mystacornis crossleyi]|nr:CD8A protein [Mystacornis crossleyi]